MSVRQHAFRSVALVEILGLAPAMVAIDRMTKAANVQVHHYELNDLLGICIRLVGDTASLQQAVEIAQSTIEQMGGECVARVLSNPHAAAMPAIESSPDYQPLIDQAVVFYPRLSPAQPSQTRMNQGESAAMSAYKSSAIGMIETQGFTAVLEAIDTACKAANVKVIGKEKLGGGYITVLIEGDVAAVEAAVQAGSLRVDKLGKLIAAHVISRPSEAIMSLLPSIAPASQP